MKKVKELNQQPIDSSLLTCWDVADGEQTDPRVPVHGPLLCLTVGLAAVVHEAREVSLRTSVDDSVLMVIRRRLSHL